MNSVEKQTNIVWGMETNLRYLKCAWMQLKSWNQPR